jgi:hypothetical protein
MGGEKSGHRRPTHSKEGANPSEIILQFLKRNCQKIAGLFPIRLLF